MGNVRPESEGSDASGGYRLVVAVGNPSYAAQLVRTAVDIARANDGEVRIVTVVQKPRDSPFSVFSDEAIREEYAGDRREILARALEVASGSVPVDGRVVVGTDVGRALRSFAREVDADALLVGWHGRPRRGEVVLGSTIDGVLRRAPCDVLVERIGPTADGVDRVLLPVAGGPHLPFAASVADAIAAANGATVVVLSVIAPSATEDERETAQGSIDEAVERLAVPTETALEESSPIDDAVLEAAADCDLVVFGATRRGRMRRRLVGSIPQAVGRRSDRTVIMARRRLERSVLDRVSGRLWDR